MLLDMPYYLYANLDLSWYVFNTPKFQDNSTEKLTPLETLSDTAALSYT